MLLTIDGLEIRVVFKAIKNIYLRVLRDGEIVLSAPRDAPPERLRQFIHKHLDWLHKKRGADAAKPQADAIPEKISVWGKPVPLVLVPGASPDIEFLEQRLHVHLPEPFDPDDVEALIAFWQRAEVMRVAPPILAAWQEKLGLAPVTLFCRNMKSRWGSCIMAKNKITVNSQLAARPLPCLELVIVHELTHFFEKGHNAKFYALLARALPDWKARAELLKQEASPAPEDA